MEHFVSVLPVFELYAFQSADARDTIISGLIESGKVDLSAVGGIPWLSVLPTGGQESHGEPGATKN